MIKAKNICNHICVLLKKELPLQKISVIPRHLLWND